MPQQIIIDEKIKDEVERFLVDKILSAVAQEQIDFALMKKISNQILDNIDSVKDYQQFLQFLEQLSKEYPLLSDVYNLYKHKFYQDKEEQVINKLSEYIKTMKSN